MKEFWAGFREMWVFMLPNWKRPSAESMGQNAAVLSWVIAVVVIALGLGKLASMWMP